MSYNNSSKLHFVRVARTGNLFFPAGKFPGLDPISLDIDREDFQTQFLPQPQRQLQTQNTRS